MRPEDRHAGIPEVTSCKIWNTVNQLQCTSAEFCLLVSAYLHSARHNEITEIHHICPSIRHTFSGATSIREAHVCF